MQVLRAPVQQAKEVLAKRTRSSRRPGSKCPVAQLHDRLKGQDDRQPYGRSACPPVVAQRALRQSPVWWRCVRWEYPPVGSSSDVRPTPARPAPHVVRGTSARAARARSGLRGGRARAPPPRAEGRSRPRPVQRSNTSCSSFAEAAGSNVGGRPMAPRAPRAIDFRISDDGWRSNPEVADLVFDDERIDASTPCCTTRFCLTSRERRRGLTGEPGSCRIRCARPHSVRHDLTTRYRSRRAKALAQSPLSLPCDQGARWCPSARRCRSTQPSGCGAAEDRAAHRTRWPA